MAGGLRVCDAIRAGVERVLARDLDVTPPPGVARFGEACVWCACATGLPRVPVDVQVGPPRTDANRAVGVAAVAVRIAAGIIKFIQSIVE